MASNPGRASSVTLPFRGSDRDRQALALLLASPAPEPRQALARERGMGEGDDAVSFACALGAFSLPWREALRLLRLLQVFRVEPDAFVAAGAINVCSRAAQWQVCLDLLRSFPAAQTDHNSVAVGAAIAGADRASKWEAALALFNLHRLKVRPSFIAFSTTVLATSRASQWQVVLELLQRRRLDAVTCTAAITACREGRSWQHATGLLFDAWAKQPRGGFGEPDAPSLTSANACLSALERASQWRRATVLLHSFQRHSLQPDEVSYNTAISACSGRLKWQHSLALLKQMRRKMLRTDSVTWTACITACSQGQNAEAALALFDQCESGNIAVTNAAIASCATTQSWDLAIQLLNTHLSEDSDARADAVSFNSTIAACGVAQAWESALALTHLAADRGLLGDVALGAAMAAVAKAARWTEALQLLRTASEFSVAIHQSILKTVNWKSYETWHPLMVLLPCAAFAKRRPNRCP
ncbi:unnamed protein product [Effrenium voratum]|uniref:Pentatricopeptide repeat-containing protein, chloroplastic n=1 Tax=Effrenium voratum TaxID=2562239 RepID=A0AA36J8G0_9DINO|nr:unnamed protein product [Effrenium voratum]